MGKLIIITLIIIITALIGSNNIFSQNKLLYHKGKPTTKGISEYIKNNQEIFIKEYQKFVKDSLYDIYIDIDNISTDYNYDMELGYFQAPNTIIITNEEKYLDYELKCFPKYKRTSYVETNAFVKAVVMHELSHYYFYIITEKMKARKKLAYCNHHTYGSEFIEEGFCEYISYKMGEFISNYNYANNNKFNYDISNNKFNNNIFNYNYLDSLNYKEYKIKYRLARLYVTPILDKGIKEGLNILLRNNPPTMEEINNEDLYIKRLK